MNKLLDITEKQMLRGYVLKICEFSEPLGAGIEVVESALKKEGFYYERKDIEDACNYLQGKGFIKLENIKNSILNIDRTIAKITPLGIDLLEGTTQTEGVILNG